MLHLYQIKDVHKKGGFICDVRLERQITEALVKSKDIRDGDVEAANTECSKGFNIKSQSHPEIQHVVLF